MSNITMVVKALQSRKPEQHGGKRCERDLRPVRPEAPGEPRRSDARLARANRAGTTRGHQSLTPKNHQPRWNSQNSRGGLSL